MGGGDLGADAAPAERPGQRDRLRRREGEVEAGDRAAAADRAEAERLAVDRAAAGQHRGQLLAVDLAVEAEKGGRGADPVALRLALAGVVVLGAFGDLLQVVGLLARAELADREHQQVCPRRARNPSWVSAIPLLAGGRRLCIGSGSCSTPVLSGGGGV